MPILEPPPSHQELWRDLKRGDVGAYRRILAAAIRASVGGRYRHWNKLRHLDPPKGLSHREWWLGLKIARERLWQSLPLLDRGGTPFKYAMTDEAWAMVHEIDRPAGTARRTRRRTTRATSCTSGASPRTS